MSEIKNGGLDEYGAEPFEQQQFGTAGVEGVNSLLTYKCGVAVIHFRDNMKLLQGRQHLCSADSHQLLVPIICFTASCL